MSAVHTEHVLVVPAELLQQIGHFQGFSRETDRYLEVLLSPEHTSYRPRSEMEQDANFKQLIPYVVFRHTDEEGRVRVFHYTRGRGQGEQRLHSKRSVGIGGHISAEDVDSTDLLHPYDEGLRRELNEEVYLDATYVPSCVGLINDDETEVGRVHLGVVHVFDVKTPDVRPRESEIIDAGFAPVAELLGQLEQFETWSQITLRALFAE